MPLPQTSLTSALAGNVRAQASVTSGESARVAQAQEFFLVAAGGGQSEEKTARASLIGIEQHEAQITAGEGLAVVQYRLALVAADQAHADLLVDAGGDAVRVMRGSSRASPAHRGRG